jgi:hypothetical protein
MCTLAWDMSAFESVHFAVSGFLSPRACDPRLERWLSPHWFASPGLAPRSRLALVFPGTGGKPRDYRALATHAAALGYHALVLSYPNDISINELAGDDASLHEPLRLDHWDGARRTGKVELGPGDSILERLVAVLAKLSQQYPEQGWEQYLRPEAGQDLSPDVAWELVAAIGHSLGGGYVALAAKHHLLDRAVVMGWADWCRGSGQIADWIHPDTVYRTPAQRRFVLVHERDEMVPLGTARVVAGYFCPDTQAGRVESGSYPWGRVRWLTTDFDPSSQWPTPAPCHNCLALDVCTPRWPDGSAVLEDAWSWLLVGEEAGGR